jgi:hypothetical protein
MTRCTLYVRCGASLGAIQCEMRPESKVADKPWVGRPQTERFFMADTKTQELSRPEVHFQETIYCRDPNCPYCKELRHAQEQLKRVKSSGGSWKVRDLGSRQID